MELKAGYKQTTGGVIPDGWEISTVGDVAIKVGSGITPTGGRRVYRLEGRPFLRSQNVGWGCLLLDDIAFIDEETHGSFSATEIKLNDVLLNITGASIGRSAVADERLLGGNVNQHVCIIRVDANRLSSHFLNLFLLSKSGQEQIDNFQAGGNRQGLNFGQIRSFQIPLPPLPDQQAIAAALSDVDVLISALDKLIAKKRDIKQATMQQLLTGKKRLPAFAGEWETKKIGALGSTFGGLTSKSKIDFEKGNARYIPFLNVISNPIIDVTDLEWVRVSAGESQNKAQRGDLFFNTSSETPEEVGMCSVLLEEIPDLYLNSFCFGFRFFDTSEVCGLYLAYYFRSDCGRNLMYALAQGATRYNLSKRSFLRLGIPLPILSEQEAIATIFSDMAAEITALERKRDKTRALKQGMMQELLTGRIRLT